MWYTVGFLLCQHISIVFQLAVLQKTSIQLIRSTAHHVCYYYHLLHFLKLRKKIVLPETETYCIVELKGRIKKLNWGVSILRCLTNFKHELYPTISVLLRVWWKRKFNSFDTKHHLLSRSLKPWKARSVFFKAHFWQFLNTHIQSQDRCSSLKRDKFNTLEFFWR